MPVGFKWFVDGLLAGSLGFGGEESAGASCLRRDGSVWTTDKDGIVLGLLAAEMTAVTGRDPGELYRDLTQELGDPVFERIDAPVTPAKSDSRAAAREHWCFELAGEKTLRRTQRPQQRHRWLKVVPKRVVASALGTEDVYSLDESFRAAITCRGSRPTRAASSGGLRCGWGTDPDASWPATGSA